VAPRWRAALWSAVERRDWLQTDAGGAPYQAGLFPLLLWGGSGHGTPLSGYRPCHAVGSLEYR